jgi:aspartyl-tRNA(Asn)/glutamyl-tRNA(Gln) amidotransferase subunit B
MGLGHVPGGGQVAEGRWEVVIGLEVHAQLRTRTKIFCGCPTDFGAPPNTQVCPVCLGLPGVLPVLNREAVTCIVRTGLALGCRIEARSRFARKNYFYPDLPKGYQISQFELPVCLGGSVTIATGGSPRPVALTRIHLEEDAGKLVHGENLGDAGRSFSDLNRAGVPLMEIVGEPELRTPEEARDYLVALRDILVHIGVCDGNMEQGSFRCDANISLRPRGAGALGTKVELKNMNSFRYVQQALEHEAARQAEVLDGGGAIVQETRLFDARTGATVSMRRKEEAHDYRYFPEPDLVTLAPDPAWVAGVRAALPELPEARRRRYVAEHGLPEYDAGVLTADPALAAWFDAAVAAYPQPKVVSNWVMGELLRLLRAEGRDAADCPVPPGELAELLRAVDAGTLSGKLAKEAFEAMFREGKGAAAVIDERGLRQVGGGAELEEAVARVVAANPDKVAGYRAGKTKLFEFFVGQVMRETKGRANPEETRRLIAALLDEGE